MPFKDSFLTVCNCHHLSKSTRESYWLWSRKHIKRVGAKSEQELLHDPTAQLKSHITALAKGENGSGEVESYSGATQNQAFYALIFLYEKVLGVKLGDLSGIPRACRHERFIEVPDHETALALVNGVTGKIGTCLRLIYSAALRANDGLRIRVKDVDFKNHAVFIQESKGGSARVVPLSKAMGNELKALMQDRERVHEQDLAAGLGWVHLPHRLAKKYPGQEKSLAWQYLFASDVTSTDPVTGNIGRNHLSYNSLQRAFLAARKRLKYRRQYTIHGLRHQCVQWLEEHGVTASTVQTLLGHKDIKVTQRYLKSGKRGAPKIPTPI